MGIGVYFEPQAAKQINQALNLQNGEIKIYTRSQHSGILPASIDLSEAYLHILIRTFY